MNVIDHPARPLNLFTGTCLYVYFIVNSHLYICLDTSSSLGLLIFYNSSLVILGLVFHLKQCCSVGPSYLVGKVLSIGV